MILPHYHIEASRIPGAGQGIFLDDSLQKGRVAVAPDRIDQTWTLAEIRSDPERAALWYAAARWFEDRYTLSPEWPHECYVNHSFDPTGLWLLGFIFTARDIAVGEELTIDYRHLLAPGQEESFHDALTGKPIVGYAWHESLAIGLEALAALLPDREPADPATGR